MLCHRPPLTVPLFYQSHIDSNGKIVDFQGWELPIHYGSQIQEHEAVRTDAGMFDVSHMVVTDIEGSDAKASYKNYWPMTSAVQIRWQSHLFSDAQ